MTTFGFGAPQQTNSLFGGANTQQQTQGGSLFGQPQSQLGGASGGTGFGGTGGGFGQPQQNPGGQPQGALFGGQSTNPAGSFGAQANLSGSQGQNSLFGQNTAQPAQGTGGFGQPAQGAGSGGTLFGGQKPAGTGLFGQSAGQQPQQQNQTTGFGGMTGFQQPQQTNSIGGFGGIGGQQPGQQNPSQPAQGLFGQSTGMGGQPQQQNPLGGSTGLFGGNTNQQQTGGLTGFNTNTGAQTSAFGQPSGLGQNTSLLGSNQQPGQQPQSQGLFGGNSAFGQPQNPQQQSQTPGFGPSNTGTNSFTSGIAGFNNQNQMNQQQNNQDIVYPELQSHQTRCSIGQPYIPIRELVPQPDAKGNKKPDEYWTFNSNLNQPNFKGLSCQMIRIMDKFMQMERPVVNYEGQACQMFKNPQAQQQYAKIEGLRNLKKAEANKNGQSPSLLQNSSSFGPIGNSLQPQQSGFTQPQQQNGLFQNPNQQNQPNGLLNQSNSAQQNSAFNPQGFSNMLNAQPQQQQPQQPGGLWNNQQQPGQQTNSLFNPQGQQQNTGFNPNQSTATPLFPANKMNQPANSTSSLFPGPGQSSFTTATNAFQQPQQQQQPAQSSLFNPNPQNSQPQQQQQPGQTGLFQQPGQQQQQSSSLFPGGQGGSLFKQPSQPNPSTSLFNPQPGTNSAFTPKPALQVQTGPGNTGSSLFPGTNTQPTSSLFQPSTTQPGTNTSLFNPQGTTQQPATSSLFNPKPATAPTSSLFQPSTNPTQQTSSGLSFPTSQTNTFAPTQPTSLFNPGNNQAQQQNPNQAQAQANQQPNPNQTYQIVNLFQNVSDPLGCNQFLSKDKAYQENFQKDLKELQNKAEQQANQEKSQCNAYNGQMAPAWGDSLSTSARYGKGSGIIPNDFHSKETELAIQAEYDRKMQMKRLRDQQMDREYTEMLKQTQVFMNAQQNPNSLIASLMTYNQGSEGSKRRRLFENENSGQTSSAHYQYFQKPDLSAPPPQPSSIAEGQSKTDQKTGNSPQPVASTLFKDQSSSSVPKSGTVAAPVPQADVITIRVVYTDQEQNKDFKFQFQINKKREVADIKTKVYIWLKKEFGFSGEEKDVRLFKMSGDRVGMTSLELAGLKEDSDIQVFLYDNRPKNKKQFESQLLQDDEQPGDVKLPQVTNNNRENSRAQNATNDQQNQGGNFMPNKPKDGYKTTPSMSQLSLMSQEQLKKVSDFKIESSSGSIEFIGETDLTFVDLADAVTIANKSAEVYDDEKMGDKKPQVGQKLNRPSIISLYNVKPRAKQTPADKERELRLKMDKIDGANFLSYDQTDFVWCFKVDHFTKYGEDDDDDNDSPTQQSEESKTQQQAKKQQMADETPREPIESSAEMNDFSEVPKEKSIALSQSGAEEIYQLNAQNERAPNGPQAEAKAAVGNFEGIQSNSQPSLFGKPKVQIGINKKRAKMEDYRDIMTSNLDAKLAQSQMQQRSMRSKQQLQSSTIETPVVATTILKKIENRQKLFDKFKPSNPQEVKSKVSDQEAKAYLQSLGLNNFNKTSLANKQRFIPKPCFHPNGQSILMTGSQNGRGQSQTQKIRLVKTQPVASAPKIEQTLDIHLQVPKHQSLIEKMDEMKIAEFLSTGHLLQSKFTDPYYRALFSHKLPGSQICANSQQAVNQLVRDLAIEFGSQQSEQFNQTFAVMCMISALFGNPNIPLHQASGWYQHKHQQNFNGKTFLALIKNFESEKYVEDHVTEKKRKNLVTELLKLICQMQYAKSEQNLMGSKDDKCYTQAYDLLTVGDIAGALKVLKSGGKTKIAMVVAQSATCSNMVKSMVKNFARSQPQQSPSLKKLLDLLTGEDTSPKHWSKQLLCTLLWQTGNSTSLNEIIKGSQNYLEQETHLIPVLLRVYARIPKSDQSLNELQGKNIASQQLQDYSLRWLTQAILRVFFSQLQQPALKDLNSNQNDKDWLMCIPDDVFTDKSVRYIGQLQAQQNFHQAFIVCQLIPLPHIRKRFLFELTQAYQSNVDLTGKPMAQGLVDKLIPARYLETVKAIQLQSHNQFISAIKAWSKLSNYSHANTLMYTYVLPLYIDKKMSVPIMLDQKQTVFQVLKDCLQQNSNLIPQWDHTSGLIYELHRLFSLFQRYQDCLGLFNKADLEDPRYLKVSKKLDDLWFSLCGTALQIPHEHDSKKQIVIDRMSQCQMQMLTIICEIEGKAGRQSAATCGQDPVSAFVRDYLSEIECTVRSQLFQPEKLQASMQIKQNCVQINELRQIGGCKDQIQRNIEKVALKNLLSSTEKI